MESFRVRKQMNLSTMNLLCIQHFFIILGSLNSFICFRFLVLSFLFFSIVLKEKNIKKSPKYLVYIYYSPKNIFIMGGGEGSTARELLRYKAVEKVVMCDIDEVKPSIYIILHTHVYIYEYCFLYNSWFLI